MGISVPNYPSIRGIAWYILAGGAGGGGGGNSEARPNGQTKRKSVDVWDTKCLEVLAGVYEIQFIRGWIDHEFLQVEQSSQF